MPNGPGPRQRRATKIANRSHVTPFDKLAQWNAEIMKLGTQGAVPSIVGNSLEFVKLKASDIPGVMNNPATADLVMNQWDILFSANGNISMTDGAISGVRTLSPVPLVRTCVGLPVMQHFPDRTSHAGSPEVSLLWTRRTGPRGVRPMRRGGASDARGWYPTTRALVGGTVPARATGTDGC